MSLFCFGWLFLVALAYWCEPKDEVDFREWAIFLGMASYPHARTQEMLDRSLAAPTLANSMQIVIVAIPQEYKDWLCNGLKNLRELARIRTAALAAGHPKEPG